MKAKAGFLLVLTTMAACRHYQAPTASEAKLIGGAVANQGQFPATVSIPGCTAVKISSHAFLTAAHCVFSEQDQGLNRLYHVGSSLTLRHGIQLAGAKTYQLRSKGAFVHPSYTRALTASGEVEKDDYERVADVAVIMVAEPTEEIPVARLDTSAVTKAKPIVIAGYGCEFNARSFDGNMITAGPDQVSGRLKWSPAAISKIAERVFKLRNGDGILTPELSLCAGDSGGPVYKDDRPMDRVGKMEDAQAFLTVMGVNSFSDPLYSSFARLDSVGNEGVAACLRDFLAGRISQQAEKGGWFSLCT